MNFKIGIDVGGTFTDFLLVLDNGSSKIYKVLSTPQDPSIGTLNGLKAMASDQNLSLEKFLDCVSVIVHGTTVTTNAVLTYSGAKTALLTTKGLRDTLEMRRGIRERQYDNQFPNVEPLVERYLRLPVEERMDYKGHIIIPLNVNDVENALDLMIHEGVEAVAVCFMNAFENNQHEEDVYKIFQQKLPDAYLTISNRILPSIRFYDRVSTTVLNSYVGPTLKRYLCALISKLRKVKYEGILLIMQSNGGVISPELAIKKPAATLLSGPAGGPVAGVEYTAVQGYEDCITVDMGGTSFDASMVKDKVPMVTTSGEINRIKLALPMLNVVTIGAGGGSIGWIDEGGLLKMGPQSAGANPGPACYDLGGELPTCTDADLVLGYLDKDFFAGGRIPLSLRKSQDAITNYIAKPLKVDFEEAAAGMYSVINVNMAAAVREVSVKQGFDPRDFPLVIAGGAGPNHACMIALELEIPVMIIPKESSIFCAAGMLMSDLKHDFVRTYVVVLQEADTATFKNTFLDMKAKGVKLLKSEGIPENRSAYIFSLDLRYVNQYHEVNVEITFEEIQRAEFGSIVTRFHQKHNALFGYSLEEEQTPVELINLRMVCTGQTQKPQFQLETYSGSDPSGALKKMRKVFLPLQRKFDEINVFDGGKLKFGNNVVGPAIIEQVNTTTFVTPEYNLLVDKFGSYTMYMKSHEKEVEKRILSQRPPA
jgi:N-methylhydantoinase A